MDHVAWVRSVLTTRIRATGNVSRTCSVHVEGQVRFAACPLLGKDRGSWHLRLERQSKTKSARWEGSACSV